MRTLVRAIIVRAPMCESRVLLEVVSIKGTYVRLVLMNKFVWSGGQTITNVMMLSKGIILLAQTAIFNDDIILWRQQSANLKTWVVYKFFFQSVHR